MSPMAEASEVSSGGFSLRRVLPPSHAGPPPPPPPQNLYHHRQIHASRPPSRVPRRTATRRPNGPDARTRRLVRRNVGGLPANSVPFHPPPTPRGRPALSILHSGASHPPKGLPSSVAGCVYAVGQGVDSGRHALFRPRREKPLLPFRRVSTPLDTPDPRRASQLAKQVHK
jgi:hypothetical protein